MKKQISITQFIILEIPNLLQIITWPTVMGIFLNKRTVQIFIYVFITLSAFTYLLVKMLNSEYKFTKLNIYSGVLGGSLLGFLISFILSSIFHVASSLK